MSAKLFNVKDGGKVIPVVFLNVEDATHTEAENYVKFVKSKVATPLEGVTIKACNDGKVDVEYFAQGEKFERVRRITGSR